MRIEVEKSVVQGSTRTEVRTTKHQGEGSPFPSLYNIIALQDPPIKPCISCCNKIDFSAVLKTATLQNIFILTYL